MSSETIVAIVSAVIALVAAVFAGVQAAKANRAAEQSVAANLRSAEAAERANELAEVQSSKYVPGWVIEHDNKSRFMLRNLSAETAYGTTLSAGAALVFRGPPAKTLGPGEAIAFLATASMSSADDRLTVSWRRRLDETAELLTWAHPLLSKR